jgi:hypothetical protein
MSANQPPTASRFAFGVPPRPDPGTGAGAGGSSKVPGSAVVKMLIGFGLALAVAVGFPRIVHGGEGTPPVGILVASAALISAFTTGALWFALRRDFGLPQRIAIYAVGYNVLIVLVKFVLAPLGVYQVNRSVTLESFVPFNTVFGAAVSAGVVLLLYLAAFALIYRLFRRGVAVARTKNKRKVVGGVAFSVVVGSLLFGGTGGVFLLMPLLVAVSATDYLRFVFSSAVALQIVIVLAVASALAAAAFRSVAERAQMYGNAAILVSFFWLGLYFLALYHALWVVYVLVIFSIWPLKVVVPK